MEELNNDKLNSRREILKKVGKTAAFVIPTLVTFSVSSLAAHASVPAPKRSHLSDGFRGLPKGH